MLFTREGWIMAIAASLAGVLALSWLGWPAALFGLPGGFLAFTALAYLRG